MIETIYYDNGQLRSKGHLINGYKEGEWKYWYSNGQLMYQGSYVKGKQEGEWKSWKSDGILYNIWNNIQIIDN